jgi:hypothetical protein
MYNASEISPAGVLSNGMVLAISGWDYWTFCFDSLLSANIGETERRWLVHLCRAELVVLLNIT